MLLIKPFLEIVPYPSSVCLFENICLHNHHNGTTAESQFIKCKVWILFHILWSQIKLLLNKTQPPRRLFVNFFDRSSVLMINCQDPSQWGTDCHPTWSSTHSGCILVNLAPFTVTPPIRPFWSKIKPAIGCWLRSVSTVASAPTSMTVISASKPAPSSHFYGTCSVHYLS